MQKKQLQIDSAMIAQIMDLAGDLAEQAGDHFPHSTFITQDLPYIDRAIGVLQEQGKVPQTEEEQSWMEGFGA